MTEKLLTRKQVAEIFTVHVKTIERWEMDGKLKPLRFNRRVLRYPEAQVQALVNEFSPKEKC